MKSKLSALTLPLLLSLALFVATGCSTSPPKVEIVEVKVQVPVYCVEKIPEQPSDAFTAPPAGSDVLDKAKYLIAGKIALEAYTKELEAVVQGCKPAEVEDKGRASDIKNR